MRRRALVAAAAALFLVAHARARTDENVVRGEIEVTAIGQQISSAPDTVAPPTGEEEAGSLSGRLNLGFEFGRGLSAVLTAEGWEGEAFDPAADLSTLVPVNGDLALESNQAVSEAYLTVRLEGTGLRVSAGKVNVSELFDRNRIAGDPRRQFINYSLCNSTAIEYPGGEDAPYGLAGWVSLEVPDSTVGFTAGYAEIDDDDHEPYYFGEVRFKRGTRFTAGAFGWKAEGLHPLLAGGGDQDGATGWGAYLDWEPRGDISVFARAAYAESEVSQIDQSWSAGLQIRGTPWNRDEDTLGIAYALNGTSDDAPGLDADEEVLEVYYRFTLLSPDVDAHRPGIDLTLNHQTIENAGGIASDSKVQLLGLRLRMLVMF